MSYQKAYERLHDEYFSGADGVNPNDDSFTIINGESVINDLESYICIDTLRPFSCACGHFGYDSAKITDLSFKDMREVLTWITMKIRPSTTPSYWTSYGLKHDIEKDTGVYITNNQMKDAMLLLGYMPVDEFALNWQFFARDATSEEIHDAQ